MLKYVYQRLYQASISSLACIFQACSVHRTYLVEAPPCMESLASSSSRAICDTFRLIAWAVASKNSWNVVSRLIENSNVRRSFSVRLIWTILAFLTAFLELSSWRGGSLNDCNNRIAVLRLSRIDFHLYDACFCVEDLYLHLILLVSRFGSRDEARKWTNDSKNQPPPGRVL